MLKRNAWLLALIGIVLLSSLQIWSTADTRRQTTQLHALLADTQEYSLQLVKELGYGGLIHNFKNLVLRPDNTDYYSRGEAAAIAAFALVSKLESNAALLDVPAELSNTRHMISAYRSRLDLVLELHDGSMSVREIDKAVRFNDDSALVEITTLLDDLSTAVNDRVALISTRDKVYSRMTVIGTIVLGGLAFGLMINYRQKQQHLSVVNTMNDKLGSSNHELSTANSSLMQFSGIVSHDLRSPLRHISMFNDLIMEDYDDRDSVEEHVQRIRKASSRMEDMIASLLDFTRAGFSEPELQRIDLNNLVSRVLEDLQPGIESSHAQIKLQLQGSVMADPVLLERVLHNLIGNSLKYTKPNQAPQIIISSDRKGDRTHVAISDKGIGIEPRFAERIFKPFERLHTSQSDFEGSGIGLSLVKAVVESHDGHVGVDTSYSEGTRISFDLQAADLQ